jgi:type IV pilus assembly protein PilV
MSGMMARMERGGRGRMAGVSLIEVAVSLLVLSIGAVGFAGLQLTAKRAGFEAVQRSTAAALANDLLERMRVNPSALASYVTAGTAATARPAGCNATTLVCDYTTAGSAQALALMDLWVWEQSLQGAQETRVVDGAAVATGGLNNPTGCVSLSGSMVEVAIAWEGYETLSDQPASTCGAGKYGTDDARRQLLSMSTVITEF